MQGQEGLACFGKRSVVAVRGKPANQRGALLFSLSILCGSCAAAIAPSITEPPCVRPKQGKARLPHRSWPWAVCFGCRRATRCKKQHGFGRSPSLRPCSGDAVS